MSIAHVSISDFVSRWLVGCLRLNPSGCVCRSVSVCLSLPAPVCRCLSLPGCPSLSIRLSARLGLAGLCLRLCLHPSVCLYVCQSVCQSLSLPLYCCLCLSASMPVTISEYIGSLGYRSNSHWAALSESRHRPANRLNAIRVNRRYASDIMHKIMSSEKNVSSSDNESSPQSQISWPSLSFSTPSKHTWRSS